MAIYHAGPINSQLNSHRCPRTARTAIQIVATRAKARAWCRLIVLPRLLKQTPAIAGTRKSKRQNRGSDSWWNRSRQNKQGRKQQIALITNVQRETNSTVNPAADAHISNTTSWQSGHNSFRRFSRNEARPPPMRNRFRRSEVTENEKPINKKLHGSARAGSG